MINKSTNLAYNPIKIPEVLTKKHWKYSFIDLLCFCIAVILIITCLFFNSYCILCLAIVFLGLSVRIFRELSISDRVCANVNCQLASREIFSQEKLEQIWCNIKRAKIAKEINEICIQIILWKRGTNFLPEDPFCLMIELYTGDLCEVECIEAIENNFYVKFDNSFFDEEVTGELKFKDIVGLIVAFEGSNSRIDKAVFQKYKKNLAKFIN